MLETIIASSAIAAVISIIANIALKRIDYKNDYYKEIFKRRIDIYAEIEDLITLYNQVVLLGEGRLCRVIFYTGIEEVLNFKEKLTHIIASGLWVNTKTLKILAQIESLLNHEIGNPEVRKAVQDNNTPWLVDRFQAVGINRFPETSILNKNLRESVNEGWIKLYDIGGFLKKGKRNIIWDFLLQWVFPFTIS